MKQQNYYFSKEAFDRTQKMIDSGFYQQRKHTAINGIEFTLQTDSTDYFERVYKLNYPDAVLVASLPKGEGILSTHI